MLDIANRGRLTDLLGIVLLLAATPAPACEKTDILTLENGDHLIGEIIPLERGRLAEATADQAVAGEGRPSKRSGETDQM